MFVIIGFKKTRNFQKIIDNLCKVCCTQSVDGNTVVTVQTYADPMGTVKSRSSGSKPPQRQIDSSFAGAFFFV